MLLFNADPFFREHQTGEHPECPARLDVIREVVATAAWRGRLITLPTRAATTEELQRVHDGHYIESVRRFAQSGGGRIEADTVVSRRSFEVACAAAGTAMAAVDAVLEGPHRRAFCAVRPPGHHARPAAAMGFCLFANVALAAVHAQQVHRLKRILIIDWDVHHGNGTQEIFYESPDVFFFSAHRYPFYPGTGSTDETGAGAGVGTTFNLPLPFGVSRDEYRTRFQSMLQQAAERCRPELVLISAGFDAHRADPIGSLGLESEDFAALTQMTIDVAESHCAGRIVSLLEGGYDLNALAECVQAHLETLLETG